MTKIEQVEKMKSQFKAILSALDARYKNATLTEKCDLIKARVNAVQAYAAAVSAICHGDAQ